MSLVQKVLSVPLYSDHCSKQVSLCVHCALIYDILIMCIIGSKLAHTIINRHILVCRFTLNLIAPTCAFLIKHCSS